MSERISDERLREMADPTWRFVGEEYREACLKLVEERAEVERLRERVTMLESENEKIAIRATGEIVELRKQVRVYEELIEIARKWGHNVDYWLMEACVTLAGTVPRP